MFSFSSVNFSSVSSNVIHSWHFLSISLCVHGNAFTTETCFWCRKRDGCSSGVQSSVELLNLDLPRLLSVLSVILTYKTTYPLLRTLSSPQPNVLIPFSSQKHKKQTQNRKLCTWHTCVYAWCEPCNVDGKFTMFWVFIRCFFKFMESTAIPPMKCSWFRTWCRKCYVIR